MSAVAILKATRSKWPALGHADITDVAAERRELVASELVH